MTGVTDDLLVDQGPDAVIFADAAGVVRRWNAAAERIFGFAAADAVGRRLDLIVPERFRDAHWEGFARAVGDGRTKYEGQSLPTRAMRADGETITVELSFAIVHDGAGGVAGALAHARDITVRFEADRAARQRTRALEEEVAALRAAGPEGRESR